MSKKNIDGEPSMGKSIATAMLVRDPLLPAKIVAVVVVGGVVIYVGYKAYKGLTWGYEKINDAIRSARSAVSSAAGSVQSGAGSVWASRPKILFKGMEQGGSVVAEVGVDELQILGGLIQ
jgi:hypothetical protein